MLTDERRSLERDLNEAADLKRAIARESKDANWNTGKHMRDWMTVMGRRGDVHGGLQPLAEVYRRMRYRDPSGDGARDHLERLRLQAVRIDDRGRLSLPGNLPSGPRRGLPAREPL